METDSVPGTKKLSRRKFFRRALWAGAGLVGAGGLTAGYGFWEASQIRIRRTKVLIPRLPAAFAGKTIAVLADLHHGPYVSLDFIRDAVRLANALKPDLFALVGDYAHKGTHTVEQLVPCLEVLSELQAPLGVFAVPGNHDMQHQGRVYREVIATTPLADLTNSAVPVSSGSEPLWLAGVDDLWWGKPDLDAALRDVPERAAVVLLSHNPDFAELSPNPRVGLMLSGHTHGGQVYLPWVGSPWLPSRYGEKYRHGLVQGPASQVFVSRGLGEAGYPVRFNAPPEIVVLTLLPTA